MSSGVFLTQIVVRKLRTRENLDLLDDDFTGVSGSTSNLVLVLVA